MVSLISELESFGMMIPDYKNSNLSFVNNLAKGFERGRADKTVFMTLDALGFSLLSRTLKSRPHMAAILGTSDIKRTSTVFPTFTLTVFPSLDSGLTPSEHGIVGQWTPVKELGREIDVLGDMSDFESQHVFPEPRNIKKFNRNGRMLYVTDRRISASAYSKIAFNGVDTRPYVSLVDMFIQTANAIRGKKYNFIYAYSDVMDGTQHKYSPQSHEAAETLYAVFMLMERFLIPELKRSGWRMFITADHGQVYTKKGFYQIKPKSRIMEFLSSKPWGSGRATFFSVVPGREKAFEDAFRREFGRDIMLISSKEAVKAGVFGGNRVTKGLEYRFGDYMSLCKPDAYLSYIYPGKKYDKKVLIRGHHGGMSPDEVEIPIIELQ